MKIEMKRKEQICKKKIILILKRRVSRPYIVSIQTLNIIFSLKAVKIHSAGKFLILHV
jgi:hypothetical protein